MDSYTFHSSQCRASSSPCSHLLTRTAAMRSSPVGGGGSGFSRAAPYATSDAVYTTSANRGEYVRLRAQHKLCGRVREQVAAMRQGLSAVLPPSVSTAVRKGFEPRELVELIAGRESIDADEWRRETKSDACATL